MRRLLILLFALAFLASNPGLAQPQPNQFMATLDELRNSGKWSNEHVHLDLVYVSKGSVTTYTYKGEAETLTIAALTVEPTENREAINKITRYIFELTNHYRPETELALQAAMDHNTVWVWIYGEQKDRAMWAVVMGLPECLENQPITEESDNEWINKYLPERACIEPAPPEPEPEPEPEPTPPLRRSGSRSSAPSPPPKMTPVITAQVLGIIIRLTIGELQATIDDQPYSLGAAPFLKPGVNRTLVPAGLLAEALGARVNWQARTRQVVFADDSTEIIMTIGSDQALVNGLPVALDCPAEFWPPDEIIVPLRFVCEGLGARVDWDAKSREITITR